MPMAADTVSNYASSRGLSLYRREQAQNRDFEVVKIGEI